MYPRIQVAPHLSPEELHARYRAAHDPVERSRLQIVWLVAQGHSSREAAEVSGFTQKWVCEVVLRYNRDGPEALADGRQHNPGHVPLLSAEQLAELAEALDHPAPDREPWSGPKVAQWMNRKLGRTIAPQRGWDYLRKAGCTPQRPRPRHKDADPQAQARFPAGVARGA
jgi:transposase